MYVHSILLASVGFFNLENLTDNNDSISRWIDPRYQYNYSLPRIINSRYFARVNRNDKMNDLRSNCPYFSSFFLLFQHLSKMPLFRTRLFENSSQNSATKADRRCRSNKALYLL